MRHAPHRVSQVSQAARCVMIGPQVLSSASFQMRSLMCLPFAGMGDTPQQFEDRVGSRRVLPDHVRALPEQHARAMLGVAAQVTDS
ncbi:hypothetical protein ASC92_21450 [Variovorax sp. Root411]|nr:hypothetical protein ASC92_21450 [Variovorax sp. Root411]